MADADIAITAGAGTKIDTRTVGAGTDEHRQVVVIGDDGSTKVASVVDETGSSAVDALAVGGATPNDSVDSGNPVKIGGKASASGPTPVNADGDRVDAWVSRYGSLSAILRGTGVAGSDGIANTIGAKNEADNQSSPLQVAPAIYSNSAWDRLRSIAALDTAPNVDTGILAAGIGPGWDRKRDPVGIAATSTGNAVTVVVDGAGVVAFHVTTIGTTPGSMIFEVTGDDTNWVTAPIVLKAVAGASTMINGAFVPAVNDIYVVRTDIWRQVRYRVNAVYASGTATVKWSGSVGQSLQSVFGDTAHDAVDGGNPVKIGGRASSAAPSAVSADGDRVNGWYTLTGAAKVSELGSVLIATAQTNISNSAATLIAARATRKRVVIINRQAAAVFVGPASVTTANGVQIDPGASLTLYTTALVQGITAAASAAGDKVHTLEEYDA